MSTFYLNEGWYSSEQLAEVLEANKILNNHLAKAIGELPEGYTLTTHKVNPENLEGAAGAVVAMTQDRSTEITAQPETYPENFIDALRFDTAQSEPVIQARKEGDLIVADLPQVPTGGGGISKDEQPDGVQGDVIVQIHTGNGWIRDSQLEAVIATGWVPPAPKKEWVGLTDKDREWCDEHSHGNTSGAKQKAYGRAIEAKLREKNTNG